MQVGRYLEYYYDQALKYFGPMNQAGTPYKVSEVYLWSGGSYDFMGANPTTHCLVEPVAAKIRAHNCAVLRAKGSDVRKGLCPG